MKTQEKRIWIVAGLVVGCCLFAVPVCNGTADPFLDGKIQVLESKIGSWERSGHLVGWLVFAVFFIGLIVAALHAVTVWWMKIVTGVLSVASAVIVGYYHQFYPADDRTYNKAVRLARSQVEGFKFQLEQFQTLDPPTKERLYKEYHDLFDRIERIENETIYSSDAALGTQTARNSAGLSLLPSAYADPGSDAGRVPDWVSNLPSDEKNFYFLGKATGKSFEEARDNALENARDGARAKFLERAKGSALLAENLKLVDQLASALASSAEVAQTFVAPDLAAGGYRGYALLRVSRSAARFTAESIFVKTSTPYDKAFLDRIQKESRN